ncbi:hypothetical protein O166_05090 [Pseudogulbenkiania ferrooxidans EGD-HP2]|uniref:Uncharacterized protein n=1 Tax=Pseudogulbenkiania ferrooxidans EGD-HP2 TaxID=1388764 RepID=A0ABN0N942_9NEIS|nr:hypothetical protein O166_05090 [Pseudogulbenkiania ferrooxidans EGD-HP2]
MTKIGKTSLGALASPLNFQEKRSLLPDGMAIFQNFDLLIKPNRGK